MYNHSTIHDKLEEIKESIELIQEWSKDVESADDFMLSPTKYMAFNACVMRLPPKRYYLLNDIINYTFSGVFSFFIRIFVPERV